jgi:hypothetical protein
MNGNCQKHQLAVFDMDNTVCSTEVDRSLFQHYSE